MQRLTHQRMSACSSGYWSPETKNTLVEKLAAYENTGLEPEEMQFLLDKMTTPRIIEQLRKDMNIEKADSRK